MLIVDDSPMNLLALGSIVSEFALHCDEAADGNEAIDRARRRLLSNQPFYKLILMDYSMPDCDGPTAAAAILRLL